MSKTWKSNINSLTYYRGPFLINLYFSLLIKQKYVDLKRIYEINNGFLHKLSHKKLFILIKQIENIAEFRYEIDQLFTSSNKHLCNKSNEIDAFLYYSSKIIEINSLIQLEIEYFTNQQFNKILKSIDLKQYHSYFYSKSILNKNIPILSDEIVLSKKNSTSIDFTRQIYTSLIFSNIAYIQGTRIISFFNQHTENLYFNHKSNEKIKDLILNFLTFISINSNEFAIIFNNLFKDRIINNNIRKNSDDFLFYLNANQISLDSFKNLSKSVNHYSHICKDYYIAKAKILDIYSLTGTDYFIPIYKYSGHYSTFNEYLKIIKSVIQDLNSDFVKIIDQLVQFNRIKIVNDGESYCSEGTSHILPYIVVNFSGTINDIFVLMHEIGHALSSYYSNQQSFNNSSVYLFGAETFAIFCEVLLYSRLNEYKIDLSSFFLEYLLNKIFKQKILFDWEYECLRQKALKDISFNDFCNIWEVSIRKYYSNSVIFYPEQRWDWVLNSSIIDEPYSGLRICFDSLMALSFFSIYLNDPKFFKSKLKDFLTIGKSKILIELFSVLNINMEEIAFWDDAFKILDNFISDYKKREK